MPGASRCHSCGSSDLRTFYEVSRIPVHSTLLMDSPGEAQSYPKGDLQLGFCRACGFVQNNLFDPHVHEYSIRCEESQGFSPRFNQFLEELTQGVIDRYGVRGKTVLEIGCGKGDWLELVCKLGGNRGIGIDPGIIPERQQESEAAGRLQFIRDLYSEKYADLKADVIACRHTLEHIHETQAFMQLVRRSIGDRKDVLVFFELPDVKRVLEEAAFWDVYYEHCSYFSLGSLARLFRACDFEVLDLWTGFADQYLLITARPGRGAGKTFPGEDDMAVLERGVDHYERTVRALRARWQKALAAYKAEGKRVVVWGSSSKGTAFLTTLGVTDEVGYVVDINPFRQKKFMPGTGHEIVGPERMVEYRPDVAVIMNPIYTEEIGAQLRSLGVTHTELVSI